jgi:hypothetical protein
MSDQEENLRAGMLAISRCGITAAQASANFKSFNRELKRFDDLKRKFNRVLPEVDFDRAWSMANSSMFANFGCDPVAIMNDWYRDVINGKDMSTLLKDQDVQDAR